MLGFLVEYSTKIGRFPVQNDFMSNPKYPNFNMYRSVFGSWKEAVRLAGLHKVKILKKCDMCGKETLYRMFERDNEENCTGKKICNKCWQKYDPNSQNSLMKSLACRRTGNLSDPDNIFGDNCEELTCRWRGIKNLNKELDCYNTPIDHSRDSELGIIQTKGRTYSPIYRNWTKRIGNIFRVDHVILYCFDEYKKVVQRIYIFPYDAIRNISSITIYKNPTNNVGTAIIPWYENYRIKEEEIIRINNIWQNIINQ